MTKEEAFKISCNLLLNIYQKNGEAVTPLYAKILSAQTDEETETIVKHLDGLHNFIGKLIDTLKAE